MGRFSFMHKQTIFKRSPTGTVSTGAFAQGDPDFGAATSHKAQVRFKGGRPLLEQGRSALFAASIAMYEPVNEEDEILVPPFTPTNTTDPPWRKVQSLVAVEGDLHGDKVKFEFEI